MSTCLRRHFYWRSAVTLFLCVTVNAGAVVGNHYMINLCAQSQLHVYIRYRLAICLLVSDGVTVVSRTLIDSVAMIIDWFMLSPFIEIRTGKCVMAWATKDQ